MKHNQEITMVISEKIIVFVVVYMGNKGYNIGDKGKKLKKYR